MKNKKIYELPVLPIYNTDSTVAIPAGGPAGNATIKDTLIAGLKNEERITSGAGETLTIKASNGFTSGAGGSIILQPGAQASTGGDGSGIIKQTAASSYAHFVNFTDSSNTSIGVINNGGTFINLTDSVNISSNQNNFVLSNRRIQRVNCTVASEITGIAPATNTSHIDGREVRLYNTGTANVTLKYASSSSTAANRLYSFNTPPSRSASFNVANAPFLNISSTVLKPTAPFYMGLWVYITGTHNFFAGMGYASASANSSYSLQTWNNRLDFQCADSMYSWKMLSATTIAQNTWHYVSCWWNGTQAYLSLNNVVYGPLAISAFNLQNTSFMVGRGYTSGWTYPMNGRLASLVFCKNPTAAFTDINTALYNSGSGILYSFLTSAQKSNWGLVSWWGLNEASGSRYDSHGSNHLTDNNSVSFAEGKVLNPGFDIVIYPGEYADLIYDATDNGNGMAGWRML